MSLLFLFFLFSVVPSLVVKCRVSCPPSDRRLLFFPEERRPHSEEVTFLVSVGTTSAPWLQRGVPTSAASLHKKRSPLRIILAVKRRRRALGAAPFWTRHWYDFDKRSNGKFTSLILAVSQTCRNIDVHQLPVSS